MKLQDIFEDIVDPDPEGDQDTYAVCIRKIDHHIRCEDNVPFERHVFRQLAPTDGKPLTREEGLVSRKYGIASSNTREFKRQGNQMEDYVEGSGREKENPAFAFSVIEEIEEGVCRVSASSDVTTMNQ